MLGNARRIPSPEGGVYGTRPNVGRYFHKLVTTTSGTVDTTNSDTPPVSGLSVAKTGSETGRYTITCLSTHTKLLGVRATLIGAADAAYGAVTLGIVPIVRGDAIASAGTVDLQFIGTNAGWADAEIADGAVVLIELIVQG